MRSIRKKLFKVENFTISELRETKGIIKRIIKRDFRGNSGLAIKNSIYSFFSSLTSKIGALIFTVVLARLLMPEMFGYYSLALSTILFFYTFAELGLGQTAIKLLSGKVSDKKKKAYFDYLFKIRLYLTFFTAIILVSSAFFISKYYYKKPIFYALIVGALYIFISGLNTTFSVIFPAFNNFKNSFYQEVIFQISRIILVSAAVLIFFTSVSQEAMGMLIILMLAISYFLVFLFVFFSAKRNFKFLSQEKIELNSKDKNFVKDILFSLSVLAISGTFFGVIDTLVLGRFVSGEYIGYYRAALVLMISAGPLITFSGVLFPLFNKLKGKRLEKAFKKSINLTLFLSILATIGTIVLAKLVVLIIFGKDYYNSIKILQLLSVLLIINPLIAMYEAYFVSQNKMNVLVKLLIISTILNILLNIVFVISLVKINELYGVYGVCIATIISRGFYLVGLWVDRKKLAF